MTTAELIKYLEKAEDNGTEVYIRGANEDLHSIQEVTIQFGITEGEKDLFIIG